MKRPRLFGCIDVGYENAIGSRIERLLNSRAVLIPGHTNQGLGAAARDTGKHRRKGLITHRPVLRIDQQPVVTAVRKLLGHRGAVRVDEQPYFRLARAQLLLKLRSAEYVTHYWKFS